MVLTVKHKAGSLALFAILLLFACRNTEKPVQKNASQAKKELTKVSLRQEWFPFAGYAGEVMAANETDSIYGLDIKIEAGADNIDPIKLVKSGSNDFGVASADRILTANEKGADLVAIGVINYTSPTCFLAKESKNIKTAKDFEGKTVGILTGTNTEYIYKALITSANLDKKKIKEVEIPFDLATFIADKYDVRPAFIYDETVSLDAKNIKYSIVEPKNFGVHFLGTVYFTTKEMIEKKPEIVQAFVNTMADGWKAALINPEKSISYLKKFDKNIDENRELIAFKKGIEYFKGEKGKVLFADMNEWQAMANTLKNLGVIQNTDIKASINYTFLDKYYMTK